MYPSFKHHNYFQLRMECDCCGTVEVFSLWPSWDTSGGHDSANPTREVNFKECGRDTRKSKSDLECITETFCFPPGRAPGTNGFVKGVTELHCGNCRGLTLLKQRRSKIPRWAFLKCCTASNQTCAYHFLHLCTFFFFLFFSPFLFSHPLNSPSWQHSAFPTDDDDVEDDDDCHGNARRVQRRMWEEWDGDGKRGSCPLGGVVSETDAGGHWLFPTCTRSRAFTTTHKIRPLYRNVWMRFAKWKENVGNTVTARGGQKPAYLQSMDVLVKEMTGYVRMNVFK